MLSTHNDSMLSTNQIEIQKEQLEQLSEMMPIDFYEKSKNVHETILKIQKVVKYSEIDGFFNRNSNILCYVGTVMMMVSLPVVQSSIRLSVVQQNIDSNLAYINTILAGAGGGLGVIIAQYAWSSIKQK